MNKISMGTAMRGSLRLMYQIWRHVPLLTSIWLGIPLVLGTLVVVGYSAQKHLIDVFMGSYAATSRQWDVLFTNAWPFVSLFTGSAIVQTILNALQNIIDTNLRDQASLSIQAEVHKRAAAVPLEWMDQPEYYDRLHRAESVAGTELFEVLQNVISAVRLVFELCGCLAVASLAHPIVAVILAVVFIISFSIRLESDLVKRRLNRDLTRPGREADYLRETLKRPETVRDMRISGSMSYLIAKWSGVMQHSLGMRMNANRREIRRGMIVSAFQILGLFGAIAWMVLQLKSGRLTAGTLVVVFQAMRQAYGISARLAFPIGKMYIQSAKILDLVEFLQNPPDAEHETKLCRTLPLQKPGQVGQIKFEDVSYQYPGQNKPVLKGIHLTLKPGETVALVGENGAGKSTLVKILLGLYTPTSGRITWDDIELKDLDPVLLRRAISAAFQDFVRYETTLRDNVGFGLPEETISDDRIRKNLRSSGADTLEQQPDGLDTRVGMLLDGGRELSGGQWQRLAISRAALRDSQLLVLDEPTSALDPQHETELYQSFRQLGRDRTVLFVSHRLGWARFADRIVVLKDGQIVEEGTHETLMAANSEYASMFRVQGEWYR